MSSEIICNNEAVLLVKSPAISCKTYSNVRVYEQPVPGTGISVMLRRDNHFVNATQILKAAGIDKGRRTKILERQVCLGVHEKIQGGFGKFQGTWVPLPKAMELAKKFGLYRRLTALFACVSESKQQQQQQPSQQQQQQPPQQQQQQLQQETTTPPKNTVSSSPIILESSSNVHQRRLENTPNDPNLPRLNLEIHMDMGRMLFQMLLQPDKQEDQFLSVLTKSLAEKGLFKPDSHQVDLDYPLDDFYDTALHWSCLIANLKISQDLINFKPNASTKTLKNRFGETALMKTVHWPHAYLQNCLYDYCSLLRPAFFLSDLHDRTVLHHVFLGKSGQGWPDSSRCPMPKSQILQMTFHYTSSILQALYEFVVPISERTGNPVPDTKTFGRGSNAAATTCIITDDQDDYELDEVDSADLDDEKESYHEILRRFVDQPDYQGNTALHYAASLEDWPSCQLLVWMGADPLKPNFAGECPCIPTSTRADSMNEKGNNDFTLCRSSQSVIPEEEDHLAWQEKFMSLDEQRQLEQLKLEPTANAWLSLKLILECDTNMDQEVIDAIHRIITELESDFEGLCQKNSKIRATLSNRLTVCQQSLKDRDATIKRLEGQLVKLQKRCLELETTATEHTIKNEVELGTLSFMASVSSSPTKLLQQTNLNQRYYCKQYNKTAPASPVKQYYPSQMSDSTKIPPFAGFRFGSPNWTTFTNAREERIRPATATGIHETATTSTTE